jgi:thioredoxin-dependent peroxiredoxin
MEAVMEERTGLVTMKGQPVTLVGPQLKVGDKAPEFSLLANDLSTVKLSDSAGKVRFLSVVPSLDTSVCSLQTKRFNDYLSGVGKKVAAYTVSCDLPFAQARFCSAEGIVNMKTLSDHREVSFGRDYGLLIKELRLLARAVLVIDAKDIIRYFQLVPEMGQEPNYEPALQVLREVIEG